DVGEDAEDGVGRPRRPVDLDPRALREDAREVHGDAAAGDVAERVDRVTGAFDEAQQRRGVEARGLEEGLTPRGAEVGGGMRVLDAGSRDDVTHEGVAVRVQAARGEREYRVAGT